MADYGPEHTATFRKRELAYMWATWKYIDDDLMTAWRQRVVPAYWGLLSFTAYGLNKWRDHVLKASCARIKSHHCLSYFVLQRYRVQYKLYFYTNPKYKYMRTVKHCIKLLVLLWISVNWILRFLYYVRLPCYLYYLLLVMNKSGNDAGRWKRNHLIFKQAQACRNWLCT